MSTFPVTLPKGRQAVINPDTVMYVVDKCIYFVNGGTLGVEEDLSTLNERLDEALATRQMTVTMS